MKRMYSAVPGRVYVATRAHSAIGERELSLSKGDKVKGQFAESPLISCNLVGFWCEPDISMRKKERVVSNRAENQTFGRKGSSYVTFVSRLFICVSLCAFQC